ncbi:hypothetical protein FOZ60_013863 [Perkinsus olseni]|uniref:Uncharacterized protein n=1 Tax=Perkinsus olseni TaxID=32597 RepID=A0A7J6N9T0_PEROL|nr:hypothetical protein FOZ60_013863 [Perkinsus olseni]
MADSLGASATGDRWEWSQGRSVGVGPDVAGTTRVQAVDIDDLVLKEAVVDGDKLGNDGENAMSAEDVSITHGSQRYRVYQANRLACWRYLKETGRDARIKALDGGRRDRSYGSGWLVVLVGAAQHHQGGDKCPRAFA